MAASTYPHLLPPNATSLERALAGPIGRINALPVNIDKLYRWDTCPVEFLPWLAWANSVDIWDDEWPEEKKRNLIRESFDLHRKKGTVYAIRRYIDYAGGTLIKAILPPDKAFIGKSMTQQEREDWLIRFPQIRFFDFLTAGVAGFGMYAGSEPNAVGQRRLKRFLGAGPAHSPPSGGTATIPTAFPAKTTAGERIGRRAFLWDKGPHHLATGLETQLRWLERTQVTKTGVVTNYEQVLIPGTNVRGFFLGEGSTKGNGPNGKRFCIASAAGDRVVSVALKSNYVTADDVLLLRNSVPPSLAPISVFPKKVAERGTRTMGQVFIGMSRSERWLDPETKERRVIKGFVAGYLPESTAKRRIYERIDLHDPNRLPEKRGATSFIGNMRLGMPPHTMQLDVQILDKRPIRQVSGFVFGHLVTSEQRKLKRVMEAVVRAKSARDKVLLHTTLHRLPETSDGYTTESGLVTDEIITAL